ncbi:hypothetical protein SLA2020_361660 [Shorea laevis]
MASENGDILLANDATNAQGWLVENGGIGEEDDLFLGTNISCIVVTEASGVDFVLEPRRSTRSHFTPVPPLMRELNEELDEYSDEEEPRVNEDVGFADSCGDRVLQFQGNHAEPLSDDE